MKLFPIVDRELRERARQGTTYWGRCAAAAVSAIVAMEAMVTYAKVVNPAALGSMTFATMRWVLLALACASILMTADSISAERREGTLGLLFLTELNAADIVWGKLAASGLTAFYVLVGFIPGLALALLCGGITVGTLARTTISILNVLFVALAAGLWLSVRARSRQRAIRNALAFTALAFVLPSLLLHFAGSKGRLFPLMLFSPYTPFHLAPSASSSTSAFHFWLSLCIAHCEGWVLLLGAASSVKRTWRAVDVDLPPVAKVKHAVSVENAGEAGTVATHSSIDPATPAPQRPLLESDPVYWVASRVPGRTTLIWAGTLPLLASVLLGTLFLPAGVNLWHSFNLLLNLVSSAAFAWLAGRFFFDARRSGELELLLSTPLGARDIVGGYWWAVWRHLRSPLLLVGFVTFLQFVFLSTSNVLPSAGLDALQIVSGPLNRVADVVAVSWVGMWFGLRARKPSLVVSWTVGLVIGLPWLISYVLSISFANGFATGLGGAGNFGFWLVGWPMLYLVKNILAIRWAAGHLQNELRANTPLTVGEWLKEEGWAASVDYSKPALERTLHTEV